MKSTMNRILLPALALGAMSSTALAEPMTLTDAQMDAVTAGQVDPGDFDPGDFDKFITGFVDENFFKNVNVFKEKLVNIRKNVEVRSRVDLNGNVADAEVLAEAFGFFTLTDGQAVTVTTAPSGFDFNDGTSTSFAEALSASQPFFFFTGGNGDNGTPAAQ